MRNKGIIVKLLVQGHLAMLRLMAGLECCFISLQILHEATFLEERGKRLGGGVAAKKRKRERCKGKKKKRVRNRN